jgi:hypothetical protein
MAMRIDAAFVDKWGPEFDKPGIGAEYVGGYPAIVKDVASEIKAGTHLSKELFLRTWNWKGAMRVIRHIKIEEYDTLYAPAFRRAFYEPPERKLSALLGEGRKLPGVGAPTGSTILHFMHPDSMPIIDVRTVEALYQSGLIKTRARNLSHYEKFRTAIDRIRQESGRTIREIDKALFAYHKIVIDGVNPSAGRRRRPCEM